MVAGIQEVSPEVCDCEYCIGTLKGGNQGVSVVKIGFDYLDSLGNEGLGGVFAWVAGDASDGPFGILEKR